MYQCDGGATVERNLNVMFSGAEKKVLPKTTTPFKKIESFMLYVARNATESCQFSVLSKQGERKNMQIKIKKPEDANFDIKVLREHYVSCEGALWPDPIVEDDGCFDLAEWKNVTHRINISTTFDTTPGEYALRVELYENGELYGEYILDVKVWNFAINPEKYIDTSFGIERDTIVLQHKTADEEELYKNYYDKLLNDYHICGRYLPYDILDPRAEEYMDDPRVTSFHIPYAYGITPDEQIIKYYNKLRNNHIWFKKALFYVVDTPRYMIDYERMDKIYRRLEKLFPGHKQVVPYYTDPIDGDGARAVDLLEKYNVVWCPKTNLFKDDWLRYYMQERSKKGERTWWYCCWEPALPYANLFIDMEGFYHRVLLWQQYLYGVKGFLYWNTTHWDEGSPWDVTTSVPYLSHYCFGDGVLFYDGARIGIDGPVGSIRLEILRSAIEDYYMLELAEKTFGREYVELQIKKVTTSVREYNDDHRSLSRVRIEIGEKLSEYYGVYGDKSKEKVVKTKV